MGSDWNLEDLLYRVDSKRLAAFARVLLHTHIQNGLNAWYGKKTQQSHSRPMTMQQQHSTHDVSECSDACCHCSPSPYRELLGVACITDQDATIGNETDP